MSETSQLINVNVEDSPKIIKHSETSWILTLEEDPDTGDLIMPLPDEILASQNWQVGDTLTWNVDDDGQCSLTKDTKSKP